MYEIVREESLNHSPIEERGAAPAKVLASPNQWNPPGYFERADGSFARELSCGQRP
jgi:hypothetical protein